MTILDSLIEWIKDSTANAIMNRRSITSNIEEEEKKNFVQRIRSLIKEHSIKSSTFLKEIVRHGFMDSMRAEIWCIILQIDSLPDYFKNYKGSLYLLFGKADPSQFRAPNFGADLSLIMKDMNDARKSEFKAILTIFGHDHPLVEYAPLIPILAALFCQKMTPSNSLACLASMVKGQSIAMDKKQEWAYFPLHGRDYLIFERIFSDLVHKIVPKVSKHISKVQLHYTDYSPSWGKILFRIFLGIYPLDVIYRIIDCYLVEGYKVLYRFALAQLILRQDFILMTSTPQSLESAMFAPIDYGVKEFFKTAFSLSFSRSTIWRYRSRNRKLSLGDFDTEDRLMIFYRPLPMLSKPSHIVTDPEWGHIWTWIPSRFRILNLDRVFTTSEHGRLLGNMYRNCAGFEPLIMIIETGAGRVLGVYISKSLQMRSGPSFFGTGETFIFSLRPTVSKYEWDPNCGNYSFICGTDTFLAFGIGPVSFGLWLDQMLLVVNSDESTTFKNPPLVDKSPKEEWEIYALEVFRFI